MKYLTVLLFILLFSGISYAVDFSVGVSPSLISVGDVNPGEQKIVKFSIFTVSDEPLLVYLSAEDGSMDFFNKGYKNLMFNFSEEKTASWIDFLSNPVELDTSQKTAGRSWNDINLLLSVPGDAEPGYHVITVKPTPTAFGAAGPTGARVVTSTSFTVLLNVMGNPKRDGIILDTTSASRDSMFVLSTFFQNTGSDTLYAKATNSVYDKGGNFIGEFSSPRDYVKPGATSVFVTPIYDNVKEGEYRVYSVVSFTTGDAQKNASVVLSRHLAPAAVAQQDYMPLVILIIIIIVILLLVYRWLRGRKKY